jgi:hypothetical protein
VRRALGEELRPIETPRAGEVLQMIVRILPQRAEWTARLFKEQIANSGIKATAKEIQNALGYLTRKGHITRVGYGRYLVDGGELITSDDIRGEPTPYGYRYLMSRRNGRKAGVSCVVAH